MGQVVTLEKSCMLKGSKMTMYFTLSVKVLHITVLKWKKEKEKCAYIEADSGWKWGTLIEER